MSDNTTALMSMKLPELKKLAAEAGVAGAATMRKGDIIAALSTQTAPAKQQDTERLSLSYDHRLVDGADAARFLTDLKNRYEHGSFEL